MKFGLRRVEINEDDSQRRYSRYTQTTATKVGRDDSSGPLDRILDGCSAGSAGHFPLMGPSALMAGAERAHERSDSSFDSRRLIYKRIRNLEPVNFWNLRGFIPKFWGL